MNKKEKIKKKFKVLKNIFFFVRFLPDTFKDITAVCGRDGKFPMFLDVSTPAINLRFIQEETLNCGIGRRHLSIKENRFTRSLKINLLSEMGLFTLHSFCV